jgi:hypothetical protein
MFDFLKRWLAPPAQAAAKPARARPASKPSQKSARFDPLPTPEVIEGNGDTDWDLWENSVSFQDSQMAPDALPATPGQRQGASAAKEPDLPDAFASIHKRAP